MFESAGQGDGAVIATGGASQVGRCLLARLSVRGRMGIAIQHRELVPSYDGVCIVEGNLKGNSLPRLEAVSMVHIPAIWFISENLPWLVHCGLKRLVCLSSALILSREASPSRYERDLASRLATAEEDVLSICQKLGVDCAILRPTMMYGHGLDRNVSRAVKFTERYGIYLGTLHADGLRQPIHADDLAVAALAILESDEPIRGRYEVGSSEVLAYDEMIGRLFDVLELPRRIVRIPLLATLAGVLGWLTRHPEIIRAMVLRMGVDLVADNSKAHTNFGYVSRSFLAGGLSDIRPQSDNTKQTK
jgi:nucleoside-diphosphate-sugar epimerase